MKYFAEGKGFTDDMLDKLRKEYSSVKKIDPTSSSYKKLKAFVGKMNVDQLKGLAYAKIKWLSYEAAQVLEYKHNIKLKVADYWAEDVEIEDSGDLSEGRVTAQKAKRAFDKNPDMTISFDRGRGVEYCSYPELDGNNVFCAGDDGDDIEIKVSDIVSLNEELTEGKKVLAKKGDYVFGKDTSKDINYVTYKGKVISTGDFDRGMDGWFMNIKGQKGQKGFSGSANDVVAYFIKNKITESIDEGLLKKKYSKKEAEAYFKNEYGSKFNPKKMVAYSGEKGEKYWLDKGFSGEVVLMKESVELDEGVEFKKGKKPNQTLIYQKGKYKGEITKLRGKFNADFDNKTVTGGTMGQGSDFKTLKDIKDRIKELSESAKPEKVNLKFKDLLEATKSKYEINHKTLSSAVGEALDYAVKRGYQPNDEDVFHFISVGQKKPSEGKTNKYTIGLEKNGKVQRKALHIQVYGKGKEGYELNCYIS